VSETGEKMLRAAMPRLLKSLTSAVAQLLLHEAGLHMHNVVKTTVFLKSMSDFAAMNEVYGRHLAPEGVVAPARSTVAVAGLPKDALVEIEVIAKDASGA